MQYQRLQTRVDGPIAFLSLTGEPLDLHEAREIDEAVERFAATPDIRVLVVVARGSDFGPGADPDLNPVTSDVDPPASLAGFPMPVVAALHGRVESVGLEIALAADIRIADTTTAVSIPEVTAGRLPCWGGTQRLTRLIGLPSALWLLLTGATIDAERASTLGLVQELVQPDDLTPRLSAFASHLGAMSPLALRYLKEAIHEGADLPLRSGMRLEGDLNTLLMTSHDRAEGIDAFFGKRPPKFEGR